jgi:hypothetical protein
MKRLLLLSVLALVALLVPADAMACDTNCGLDGVCFFSPGSNVECVQEPTYCWLRNVWCFGPAAQPLTLVSQWQIASVEIERPGTTVEPKQSETRIAEVTTPAASTR